MKAVVCSEFGPPENLTIEELADPVPGPGEVVVDIRAAAITFPDTLIIENRYQFRGEPPFVVGGEVGGTIAAVGPDVDGLAVGDDVVGGGGTGGFAEQVLLSASQVRKLPQGLGHAEATGYGYAYGTGHYALKYRGDLKPGETLLVLGAAGAVGLAALELGKVMGARVIAAASTEEKLELCRRARRRRDDQLRRGGPEGPRQGTHRRQGRRRRLRRGRRRVRGGGAAGHSLARAVPGDRVHRRNPADPAQSHPAQGLRHRRRVLGRLQDARAGAVRSDPGRDGGAGRRRQDQALHLTTAIRWSRFRRPCGT